VVWANPSSFASSLPTGYLECYQNLDDHTSTLPHRSGSGEDNDDSERKKGPDDDEDGTKYDSPKNDSRTDDSTGDEGKDKGDLV
jgi:hypothetical protein